MIKGNKSVQSDVLVCFYVVLSPTHASGLSVAPAVSGAAYRRRRRLLLESSEKLPNAERACGRLAVCVWPFPSKWALTSFCWGEFMRQKMSPYGCEIRSVSPTTNQTTRLTAREHGNNNTDCRLSHGDDGAAIAGWQRLTHRTNRGSHSPGQLQCHQQVLD